MAIIHKYVLPVFDRSQVAMPAGAKILSVQLQYEQITLWAKHDQVKEDTKIARNFVIVGTEREFDDAGLLYIGTVQLKTFVWHVFEVIA